MGEGLSSLSSVGVLVLTVSLCLCCDFGGGVRNSIKKLWAHRQIQAYPLAGHGAFVLYPCNRLGPCLASWSRPTSLSCTARSKVLVLAKLFQARTTTYSRDAHLDDNRPRPWLETCSPRSVGVSMSFNNDL